ncbi:MAG: hypothetical protein MUF64_32840 [Polyangiaceae bacterium]|nr:hypothetical protein [Polyangiaceae bacterium]
MKAWVFSRGAIEAIQPFEVPHVIVSITSAPEDQARLPVNDRTQAVLRLSFADRDRPSFPGERLFEADDARAVWGLFQKHRGVDTLVVHCDAGLCRSPAVAAAVSRAFTGDDEEFFRRYRPNMRVYRMLLDIFYGEYEADFIRVNPS